MLGTALAVGLGIYVLYRWSHKDVPFQNPDSARQLYSDAMYYLQAYREAVHARDFDEIKFNQNRVVDIYNETEFEGDENYEFPTLPNPPSAKAQQRRQLSWSTRAMKTLQQFRELNGL